MHVENDIEEGICVFKLADLHASCEERTVVEYNNLNKQDTFERGAS